MASTSSVNGSGAKRKRGLKMKPREEVGSSMPVCHRPRVIRYGAVEDRPTKLTQLVPLEERVLRQHTLLRFELGTDESVLCDKFAAMCSLQHRCIDWALVEQLGQRQRIEDLLGPRWIEALACDWPQYSELTVEFHSTWRYRIDTFDEPDSVSFALGRHTYEMSIPQFATALGFYTEEEVSGSTFRHSLRGVFNKRHAQGIYDSHLRDFWSTIAGGAYGASVPESSIRDPIIRYIHRILACTFIGRKSGQDKCNQLDLFCLYCILGRREANLATILLSSFARLRKGGDHARLALGPYIGRLAKRLGVFDRYPRHLLTLDPKTVGFGLNDLRKAGICAWDKPIRWMEVNIAKRPHVERPQAMHRRKEPRPERITLAAIWDRIDRQDDMLRYMMTQLKMEIPQVFRVPDQDVEDEHDDSNAPADDDD